MKIWLAKDEDGFEGGYLSKPKLMTEGDKKRWFSNRMPMYEFPNGMIKLITGLDVTHETEPIEKVI
jgi:hypothetical protein